MADGSDGNPHFVKRFGLSERYERRFTNDEDRTRWAASVAEANVQTERFSTPS